MGVPDEARFVGVPVVADSEVPVVSMVTKRQWMVLVSGMYEKTFSGGIDMTDKGCTLFLRWPLPCAFLPARKCTHQHDSLAPP